MRLPDGEREAGPWRSHSTGQVVTCLLSRTDHSADRPVVVAIDGRSGSGKTRLAARLAAAVTPSALIHTDDLSWNHAFFDWADLLVDVLAEVRANRHRGSAR